MPEQTVKHGLKDVKGIGEGTGCLVWGGVWVIFVLVVGYWYCGPKFCGGPDDATLGTPISAFGGILCATVVTVSIHFILKWNNLSQLRRRSEHEKERRTPQPENRKFDPKKDDQARASADSAPITSNSKDLSSYEILGIQVGASPDEIKSAYKKAAQHYHPDKVSHLAPEFRDLAEDRMREINAAYEELVDR
jgi:hypothetical protein